MTMEQASSVEAMGLELVEPPSLSGESGITRADSGKMIARNEADHSPQSGVKS